MTSLDKIQLARADEQIEAFGSVARRVYCRCGCQTWWYAPEPTPEGGRPREYLDHDHWLAARRHRRALRRAAARASMLAVESIGW